MNGILPLQEFADFFIFLDVELPDGDTDDPTRVDDFLPDQMPEGFHQGAGKEQAIAIRGIADATGQGGGFSIAQEAYIIAEDITGVVELNDEVVIQVHEGVAPGQDSI